MFETWQRGDMIGPAKFFVMNQTIDHLRSVNPSLIEINGRFHPALRPANLLSAIWLQFQMEEVCGEVLYFLVRGPPIDLTSPWPCARRRRSVIGALRVIERRNSEDRGKRP
jgi:hypothetical protein